MNIVGGRRIVLLGALAATSTLAGCDAVLGWLDDLAAQTDPEPPPPRAAAETPEEGLPEKPSTSTARSETEVISFRTVLENRELTREERIRAFQNLDPGALQKPVARANVSGAPTAVRGRQPSREPADYEVAAARRRVPVVMYSTSWCGVCKRARKYFEEKRIAFEELDVDEDPSARAEYVRLNPRHSVPTIKIGDEVVVGFSAAAVERALDAAARSRMN
jgi:glutaredoxin-like YruB-family protein